MASTPTITTVEQLQALLALRAKAGLRLGELLVASGKVGQAAVDAAMAAKLAGSGGRLGDILVGMGALTREELDDVLEQQAGMPVIDLKVFPVSAAALASLQPASAHLFQCLPVALLGKTLVGAFISKPTADQLAALRFATGHQVVALLASNPALHKTLLVRNFQETSTTFVRNSFVERDTYDKLSGSTDTPAGLYRSVVAHSLANGASDIHLRPQPNGETHVFMRVDGLLRLIRVVFQKHVTGLIRHIQVLSNIDFFKREGPKEGRMAIEFEGRNVDLRVSVIQSPAGESVVLRVLDPARFPLSLEHLTLPRPQLRALSGILMRPHGLLVAVGPTGSGKTTTLYTMLRELQARNLHVVTAEDPVEYRLAGVNQFESKDFAGLLPQLLRHDPDVVMVGELRDEQTVRMAVNAALTGHLVLSTVHANDSASTVHRLMGLGAPMHVLSSCLAGILSQRLVRLTCRSCNGAGCEECGRTGFLGRQLVAELAKPRTSMSGLTGMPTHYQVQEHLDYLGGTTLNGNILELAKSGATSWQEAAELVTDPLLLPLDLREALGYLETERPKPGQVSNC